MTWAAIRRSGYRLVLSDGCIRGPPPQNLEPPTGHSPEQILADRVYRLAKGLHLSEETRRSRIARSGMVYPASVHVWVIGSGDNWLASAPPLYQAIGKDIGEPGYRIFVAGVKTDAVEEQRFVPDWNSWLWQGGMRKKFRHHDVRAFLREAGSLLESAATLYHQTARMPTAVFQMEGVSVASRGD